MPISKHVIEPSPRCSSSLAALAVGLILLAGALLAARPAFAQANPPAPPQSRKVVVYTSLDQEYSEPILRKFEAKTGIKVEAVYDAEAAKTVGLVNRILAERPRPRCDVFWNNELLRTLLLKRENATEAYQPREAAAFPDHWRDPEGHWTAFGARARVIIYNQNRMKGRPFPQTIGDLSGTAGGPAAALANPLFGTTATHSAVLWEALGAAGAQKFFRSLKSAKTVVAAGNAMVRDQVAAGEIDWGLTDSDDANGALLDGKPVGVLVPDGIALTSSATADAAAATTATVALRTTPPSGRVALATPGARVLFIPNAVSVIRRAPHPEEARALVEYLLSAEVEAELARSRSVQFPLRPGLAPPPGWEAIAAAKPLEISWTRVLDSLRPSAQWLDQEFVR